MITVKELKERLSELPDDYIVVIYPKYSGHKVSGYEKYTFRKDQVCTQEPTLIDSEKKDGTDSYLYSKHVAILF
jgi:hypothetical protein